MQKTLIFLSLVYGLLVVQITACYSQSARLQFKGMHNDEPIEPGGRALIAKRQEAYKVLKVARVHLAEGDLGTAKGEFRKVVSLDPHNAEGWSGLAEVAKKQGNLAEAIKAYRVFLYPTSDWGTTFSSDRSILFRYAQVCDRAGQVAEAAKAYSRVIDGATLGFDYPALVANPQNGKELRALAWVAVGIERQKQVNTKQAVIAYREAIRLSPQLAIAHLYLGAGLSQMKLTPGAGKEGQAEFKKASELGRGPVKQYAEKLIGKQ